MKPVPRVRLIQSWQTYSKGQFLWPDSAITRNWLIATGRAVLDPEVNPGPTIATAPSRSAQRPRRHQTQRI